MKLLIVGCFLLATILESEGLNCYECSGGDLNPGQDINEIAQCQDPEKFPKFSKPCPDPNNSIHNQTAKKHYCAVQFNKEKASYRRCFDESYYLNENLNKDKSDCLGGPDNRFCMCDTEHCNDNRYKKSVTVPKRS